jgi:hypothetical protein
MALDVINPFGFLRGAVSLGGTISPNSTARVKLTAPASSTYTFSGGFRVMLGGGLLTFTMSDTYVLTADIKAAVLAAATVAGSTATAV